MKNIHADVVSICGTLGIPVPRATMDQVVTKRLIEAIKTKLDTYDPLPTGDAAVGDVRVGKTFSNATGTGLTGTWIPEAFTVTKTLTGLVDSNTDTAVVAGFLPFTGVLSLDTGYTTMPATITITAGGDALVADTDYTYNAATGAYLIAAAAITRAIVITAVATA